MADTKISALTAVTTPAATDELAINQAGASKKLTLAQLEAFLETRGLPEIRTLTTLHSNSTTTPTKVTDLDMPLAVGHYRFEYWLIVRAATAGVAPQFNLNFGGTGAPVWWFEYADLSATLLAAIGQVANEVTTKNLGFGMRQASRTEATTAAAIMGPTAGLQTTASDHLIKISGMVVVTGAGNLELWHSSETATATTVEVGSNLTTTKVG